MAADQTLEFEVITTNGEFVRASPSENEDLFWALSGGVSFPCVPWSCMLMLPEQGGGTYGIVWSVTIKIYTDMPVTTVSVLYEPPSSDKSALDTHWKSISTYLTESPKYLSAGAYYTSFFDNTIFRVAILFPKKTPQEVATLTQPWFSGLRALNITPAISETVQHPTVRNATALVPESNGGEILTGTELFGARILPKRLWETEQSRSTLFDTLRGIVNDGGHILDTAVNPTKQVSGSPNNAVLPAFRTMHSMCIVATYVNSSFGSLQYILTLRVCHRNWNDTASWDEQFGGTRLVTSLANRLAKIAPETGAYLNEVSFASSLRWLKIHQMRHL